MREIVFRAKRYGSGKWVYGDLIHRKPGVYIRMMNGAQYQVDPDTVGQYTGLTAYDDKVVEGDVLHVSGCWRGDWVVEYFDDGFVCKLMGSTVDHRIPLCDCLIGGAKVIGNRWDNPELLGEEVEK